MDHYEKIAQELETSENYRILRRLELKNNYCTQIPDGCDIKTGLYLDVETTGLKYDKHEIIELAMVPFQFTVDGRLLTIGPAFNELQEPTVEPISTEISALTGITNEMVKGQSIDADEVEKILNTADIVIAHNAEFDRKFVEKNWPLFELKAWGCSQSDVLWAEEGVSGSKLEYIAVHYGFFYDAHRAEMDCRAGLEILSRQLPVSGKTVLNALLEAARKPTFRIWAENAPFDFKDILKDRKYRWNDGNDGRPKAWYLNVSEDTYENEMTFLKKEIYQCSKLELPVTRITAFNRFSDRT